MAELIVSLDLTDRSEIKRIIEILGDSVSHYKVGAVPLIACGLDIVEYLKRLDKKVFFDLKFYDIPNTVEQAVYSVCKMDVDLLTVHSSGGKNMLRAAISGRNKSGSKTKIIGVTLLTSFSQEDLDEMCIKTDVETHVLKLAQISFESGLDGIVCSVKELSSIRSRFPVNFLTVCPGIRIEPSSDDQKRVSGITQAIKSGADYIVVGRPVIMNKEPLSVVKMIRRLMEENETD